MNDLQKITEWSKRIHELELSKGWWQDGIKNRSVAEIVANLHGEISEAWEEYRAGRMDTWFSIDGQPIEMDSQGEAVLRQTGRTAKPEGFWVECADLVIRLMDAIGACDWEVFCALIDNENLGENIPEFIVDLHATVADMLPPGCAQWQPKSCFYASGIITGCLTASRYNDVDLWSLIELKHAYNQTRPYRHNNKLA